MQIRGPWLAYVLVRQLCFIVADEDVRHAQLPQAERYSENDYSRLLGELEKFFSVLSTLTRIQT